MSVCGARAVLSQTVVGCVYVCGAGGAREHVRLTGMQTLAGIASLRAAITCHNKGEQGENTVCVQNEL